MCTLGLGMSIPWSLSHCLRNMTHHISQLFGFVCRPLGTFWPRHLPVNLLGLGDSVEDLLGRFVSDPGLKQSFRHVPQTVFPVGAFLACSARRKTSQYFCSGGGTQCCLSGSLASPHWMEDVTFLVASKSRFSATIISESSSAAWAASVEYVNWSGRLMCVLQTFSRRLSLFRTISARSQLPAGQRIT